jgi:cystathionine gamma-lyase/cystathionine beta-lyase/cystathionine gamma-lyase/homocysteine desulfhydrase
VLRLTDLAELAALSHARGVTMAVDNTFASPCLQQPLALGADLVVHSTTKYLNGPSDSVGGVVIATRPADIEWLRFVQNAGGAILSPFDSWLVLRGTKTLALRMAQHSTNGLALAEHLSRHPRVERVHYPGLPDHPQLALARRQMPSGFGGMLAFEVGSLERARAVLNRFRLMALAESLGGVESLVGHPATMTHASVSPERRRAVGITDGLIRISAGVEDPADLIEDLDQALEGL